MSVETPECTQKPCPEAEVAIDIVFKNMSKEELAQFPDDQVMISGFAHGALHYRYRKDFPA